jgi:hypothetical protein
MRASKLGVSLGNSPSKVLESINKLKGDDLARSLIILERNVVNGNNMLEDSTSFIVQEANKLCEDLLHEEGDEAADHKDLSNRLIKTKRVYRNRNFESAGTRRRSERLKKT